MSNDPPVTKAAANERVKKVIGDILELDHPALIRVLGYLVAHAELGDWLDDLEQEISRVRTNPLS